MHDDVPSRTAAWVALLRGLGRYLPPDLRLIEDPFGLRFAGDLGPAGIDRVMRLTLLMAPLWLRGRVRNAVVSMQLRSRAIDDALVAFVRGPVRGRQVVLLGAGFDCRAWRLLADDRETTFFEVDHPATQRRKRERMGGHAGARVRFLSWDFERDALDGLADRLAELGFETQAPTFTVLEGVTMYLTEAAIESTFACVARYSAPGSRFAFTYSAAELLHDTSAEARRERAVVRLVGEPFRFGFDPATLGEWLGARGFQLEQNESLAQIAARLLLPERLPPIERSVLRRLRYVAVASYAATP
jgi:methyltransferase (TIGR00027 family)